MDIFLKSVIRKALLVAILFSGALSCIGEGVANEASPVGRWRKLDASGALSAIIEISQAGGELKAVILEAFSPKGEKVDAVCVSCTGANYGRPITGMTIMWGLKPLSDGGWGGGTVLLPKSGKIYDVDVHFSPDHDKLFVRGFMHIRMLGRTETWTRDQ